MLSSRSPLATRQRTSISQGNSYTSDASAFAAAAQGTPLHPLPLVARWDCFPGSHGVTTIWESVLGRLPPPGHCTESRRKPHPHPHLSVEEAYLPVLGLQPERQPSGLAHIWRPVELLSGNTGRGTPSLRSPSALLQLASIYQRAAYTLVWSPEFWLLPRGHLRMTWL